jgi:hypothetical protein
MDCGGTPLNPKPYLKVLEVAWKEEEEKKMGCNSNDMSQRCPWRANSQHVCIARKPAANKHEKTVGLYVSSSSDNEDLLGHFQTSELFNDVHSWVWSLQLLYGGGT